jgi:hypothetical protein
LLPFKPIAKRMIRCNWGDLIVRFAISFLVKSLSFRSLLILFLLNLPIGATVSEAAKQKQEGQPPMDFILVQSLTCLDDCPQWISAEGRITADTPARLRKFLKKIGDRKVPVVLRSEGGSVDAAYAMGRMIRKAGLETAVGGTQLKDCPDNDRRCAVAIAKDGTAVGDTYSDGAFCFSACPLVLAGGTSRASSQWSYIGVHQITTIYQKMRISYRIEYKIVNGKKTEVSRKEVGRKATGQSSSTKLGKKATAALTGYLKEMGVSSDLVGVMMATKPSSISVIAPDEAVRMGLLTDVLSFSEWPGMPLCPKDAAANALCYGRPAAGAAVAWAPVPAAPAEDTSGGLPKNHSMDFVVMYNGNCQDECTQWISADGDITPDTPVQLEAILKTLGGKKLPVVFQSFGGDRDAAFAIGRMIRAAGLETTVGRTRLPNCPILDPRCEASIAKSGLTEGEVFAGGGYCFSSCTLAFMGGKPRVIGNSAIGLSQPGITLTESERDEFYAYFNEMGISPDTFDTMMITPPFGRGDILHPQALKLDIIDGVIPYEEEPGLHICGPDAKESIRCPRKPDAAIVPVAASAH